MEFLDKFFHIKDRGSDIATEVIGGVVTFLAMVYILPVNSFMLANAGMSQPGVFVATALAAGFATILMGVLGKVPIALASGMGINAFFTFTVVLSLQFTWQEALAATFVSGVLFLIVSLTGLRKLIINAIPKGLKLAIGVGIGFFIAFIGLKNAGIIVADPFGTYVKLGDLGHPTVLLGVFGIALVLVLFTIGGKIGRFAIIISMLATGLLGIVLGALFGGLDGLMPSLTISNLGDIGEVGGLFGQAFGALGSLLGNPLAYPVIITFLFIDFFDTSGTLVSVGQAAGLLNSDGEIEGNEQALIVDAVGTIAGSIIGTSTVTSYIESNTGIQSGAKTGLASVVTGVLFLLAVFLYPLFGFVDAIMIDGLAISPVTSLALVFVGVLMMKPLKDIDFDDPIMLSSAFVTIIMMILTFKISDGIAFGFMTYALLMAVSNRRKEANWMVYLLGGLFFLYFVSYYVWIA